MDRYTVTGMSCAACSARVEKAVSAVDGVTSCTVDLLTNAMSVEGTAAPSAVIAAVEKAGYGAQQKGASGARSAAGAADEAALADRTTPKLVRRLIVSAGFLLLLMYVSMGRLMWGWPLPSFLADDPMALGLTELLLTTAVMVVEQRFFISGTRSVLHGAPNMDTLVSLGAGAAYVYSTVVLFQIADATTRGDLTMAMHHLHGLYFESAAMILTLITVGKMLEARAKGRTTDALRGLMRLAPKTARRVTADKPFGDLISSKVHLVVGGVFEFNNCPTVLLCNREEHARALERIFHAVADEILQHAGQLASVRPNGQLPLGNGGFDGQAALLHGLVLLRERLPGERAVGQLRRGQRRGPAQQPVRGLRPLGQRRGIDRHIRHASSGVTAVRTACTIRRVISTISGTSRIMPDPAPRPAIFFTGQPKLMSMMSGPAASAMRAASTIGSIRWP